MSSGTGEAQQGWAGPASSRAGGAEPVSPAIVPALVHSRCHSFIQSVTPPLTTASTCLAPGGAPGSVLGAQPGPPGWLGDLRCAWPPPAALPGIRANAWVRPVSSRQEGPLAAGLSISGSQGQVREDASGGKCASRSPCRVRTLRTSPSAINHRSSIDTPSAPQPVVVSVETRVPGEAWGVGAREGGLARGTS